MGRRGYNVKDAYKPGGQFDSSRHNAVPLGRNVAPLHRDRSLTPDGMDQPTKVRSYIQPAKNVNAFSNREPRGEKVRPTGVAHPSMFSNISMPTAKVSGVGPSSKQHHNISSNTAPPGKIRRDMRNPSGSDYDSYDKRNSSRGDHDNRSSKITHDRRNPPGSDYSNVSSCNAPPGKINQDRRNPPGGDTYSYRIPKINHDKRNPPADVDSRSNNPGHIRKTFNAGERRPSFSENIPEYSTDRNVQHVQPQRRRSPDPVKKPAHSGLRFDHEAPGTSRRADEPSERDAPPMKKKKAPETAHCNEVRNALRVNDPDVVKKIYEEAKKGPVVTEGPVSEEAKREARKIAKEKEARRAAKEEAKRLAKEEEAKRVAKEAARTLAKEKEAKRAAKEEALRKKMKKEREMRLLEEERQKREEAKAKEKEALKKEIKKELEEEAEYERRQFEEERQERKRLARVMKADNFSTVIANKCLPTVLVRVNAKKIKHRCRPMKMNITKKVRGPLDRLIRDYKLGYKTRPKRPEVPYKKTKKPALKQKSPPKKTVAQKEQPLIVPKKEVIEKSVAAPPLQKEKIVPPVVPKVPLPQDTVEKKQTVPPVVQKVPKPAPPKTAAHKEQPPVVQKKKEVAEKSFAVPPVEKASGPPKTAVEKEQPPVVQKKKERPLVMTALPQKVTVVPKKSAVQKVSLPPPSKNIPEIVQAPKNTFAHLLPPPPPPPVLKNIPEAPKKTSAPITCPPLPPLKCPPLPPLKCPPLPPLPQKQNSKQAPTTAVRPVQVVTPSKLIQLNEVQKSSTASDCSSPKRHHDVISSSNDHVSKRRREDVLTGSSMEGNNLVSECERAGPSTRTIAIQTDDEYEDYDDEVVILKEVPAKKH